MINEKIFGINSFLLDSKLFYLKENYLFDGKTKYPIGQEGYKIVKYKNNILIEFFSLEDGFERTMILFMDQLKKEPIISTLIQRGRVLENGVTVFLDYDKEYNVYLNVIDINLYDKIKWRVRDTFHNSYIINNNHIILMNKQDLIFLDYIENSELWQFSIANFPSYINGFFREQEADIKQIVGVYNNILWVHIGGWHLVGLDINTGEKVHHIEDILSLLSLNREERLDVNLDDTIHLNEKEGVLKAFAHRYYFEIDLNTLSGKVKKDFGPNWNPDWRIRYSTCYQEYPNLLFFCGYNKEIHFPNAFGIFDTEKAEIVWYDTTKDDLGYFYNPPQANDKLLAVLDDRHNLLIYERDAMQ